jgi:hypothetical protein
MSASNSDFINSQLPLGHKNVFNSVKNVWNVLIVKIIVTDFGLMAK